MIFNDLPLVCEVWENFMYGIFSALKAVSTVINEFLIKVLRGGEHSFQLLNPQRLGSVSNIV